jgi:hypothetical protein
MRRGRDGLRALGKLPDPMQDRQQIDVGEGELIVDQITGPGDRLVQNSQLLASSNSYSRPRAAMLFTGGLDMQRSLPAGRVCESNGHAVPASAVDRSGIESPHGSAAAMSRRRPSETIAVLATGAAFFMIVLDTSIVNLALPPIGAELASNLVGLYLVRKSHGSLLRVGRGESALKKS